MKTKKYKYTDFYDVLERFAIMTVDGHLTDAQALKLLYKDTEPNLYLELCRKYAPNSLISSR